MKKLLPFILSLFLLLMTGCYPLLMAGCGPCESKSMGLIYKDAILQKPVSLYIRSKMDKEPFCLMCYTNQLMTDILDVQIPDLLYMTIQESNKINIIEVREKKDYIVWPILSRTQYVVYGDYNYTNDCKVKFEYVWGDPKLNRAPWEDDTVPEKRSYKKGMLKTELEK